MDYKMKIALQKGDYKMFNNHNYFYDFDESIQSDELFIEDLEDLEMYYEMEEISDIPEDTGTCEVCGSSKGRLCINEYQDNDFDDFDMSLRYVCQNCADGDTILI